MADDTVLHARIEELTGELERLRLTLDVVGTVDLDSGILNRTGLLDALDRGRRWLARRGDIYGLIVVHFPSPSDSALSGSDGVEFAKHVAATVGAAVRDVDDVGRVDQQTFAAVLADLNPGTVDVVANRLQDLLTRLVGSDARLGGEFRVGAVEVLAQANTSGDVLDRATTLAMQARPNSSELGQM